MSFFLLGLKQTLLSALNPKDHAILPSAYSVPTYQAVGENVSFFFFFFIMFSSCLVRWTYEFLIGASLIMLSPCIYCLKIWHYFLNPVQYINLWSCWLCH
jgi:vacuolar-type H+-ATPase subunit I/STV1